MFSRGLPVNMSATYLFVDGECLIATMGKFGERYFDGVKPTLDWIRLRSGHRKVFYYDAIPVQRPD